MKKISKFYNQNKGISVCFIISLLIAISYIATLELPEIIDGIEKWYNLAFQFSIGIICSFIFYIFQVYIPDKKRNEEINKCIKSRLITIKYKMKNQIDALSYAILGEEKGIYTKEQLLKIAKEFDTNTKVNVINENKRYLTGIELIYGNIEEIKIETDKIFMYYNRNISVEIMKLLEEINQSSYVETMKSMYRIGNMKLGGSTIDNNQFLNYYLQYEKLREIIYNDFD